MARSDNGGGTDWRWGAYQAAVAAGLALAGPVLLARKGGHYLPTLRGRLALAPRTAPRTAPSATPSNHPDTPPVPPLGRGGLWLHAVSVGEVGVAATLARGLPAHEPALVTTITPTGQERAQAAFAGRSQVAYLPFDLGPPVERFFDRFRPRALVLVEGDYWPLVLRAARRRGLPMAVVNGRVGDRSFERMEKLGRLRSRLLRPLFGSIERFAVQTDLDRDRLLELGVPSEKIRVTGNLKYETSEPPSHPALDAALRRLADGRPIVVAGSTMAGEEEAVTSAFERLTEALPDGALLVLAPRHPERFGEVAERLESAGRLDTVRRSGLEIEPPSLPSAMERPDVVVLDSLGELAGIYRIADAAFIGGTLVDTGGHNPLEAARFGVPVSVGPSMFNFRQMADEFDAASAWGRAADAEALGALWIDWLGPDPAGRARGARVGAAGRALVEANRGALAKTIEWLEPLLRAAAPPPPREIP